jgi:hypothetical protein
MTTSMQFVTALFHYEEIEELGKLLNKLMIGGWSVSIASAVAVGQNNSKVLYVIKRWRREAQPEPTTINEEPVIDYSKDIVGGADTLGTN